MNEDALALLLRILDCDSKTFSGDRAGIALLAAGFSIERGLVDYDRNNIAFSNGLYFRAIADKRSDNAFGNLGLVSEKFRRTDLILDTEPDRFGCSFTRTSPVRTGLGLLALHGGTEAIRIDGNTALTKCILRQIQRKAIGVVKLESGFAVEAIPFNKAFRRIRQEAKTAIQRLAETGFLKLERFGDQGIGADQFRIGLSHFADQGRQQAPHQRLFGAQELGMTHCTAHDATQNIAAAFVGRQNTVSDQEARSAQMISNHTVAGAEFALSLHAGCFFRSADQCLEEIDIVIVVHALQNRSDALQPHSGVDRRTRQVDALFGRDLLELHENEVPDFDETVTVFVSRSGRSAPDMVAVVEEDF